jgi:hypothetical protein
MTTIATHDGTEIYDKDWGKGPAVTLSHGWSLSSAWLSRHRARPARPRPFQPGVVIGGTGQGRSRLSERPLR